MSDKMTIIGHDGTPWYQLDDKNRVTDLRTSTACACLEPGPVQQNGEQFICLVCGKLRPQP